MFVHNSRAKEMFEEAKEMAPKLREALGALEDTKTKLLEALGALEDTKTKLLESEQSVALLQSTSN
ncbi:hypothetical protein L484_024013 [Morus notabilis]|uniref:Uncharacterized protein n=1 Tax=Morus notabilis TaxID=981085 RepID=W9RNZ5_9ROSA|nr:hypothetical protein L484_024013 [Morus notabilis]